MRVCGGAGQARNTIVRHAAKPSHQAKQGLCWGEATVPSTMSTPMTPDEARSLTHCSRACKLMPHTLGRFANQVNAYLDAHNLETILADAVNDAVTARAEDPVIYIADVLIKRAKARVKNEAAGEEGAEVADAEEGATEAKAE